jgi:hypothetical protein
VLTGSGLLWVAIVGLMVAAWTKRRRRARAILAQWAREEAEQQARAQAALETSREPANAQGAQPGPDGTVLDVPSGRRSSLPPSLPLVEHDGRWYTLH